MFRTPGTYFHRPIIKISKFCWLLILAGLTFFFNPQLIQAQDNDPTAVNETENQYFHTVLNSTYTVNIDGQTRVEHHFKITNLSPEYFVSKYGLKISSDQVEQVQVVSQGQTITPQVTHQNNQTNIGITFPDKIVGKDKIREFSLIYQNPDLAQVNGQVLEVNIPAMANPEHYQKQQAVLVIPAKFGLPTRITPDNHQFQPSGSSYSFTYSNLAGQGISAIFGREQIFDFQVNYHLTNPTNQLAITQISLPPDTLYQQIYYQELTPLPSQIKTDVDGNWIATYQLPASQTVTVTLKAQALVSTAIINPQLNITPLAEHLENQPYWPSDEATILQLAAQHPTAADIYEYTVATLDYTQQDLSQEFDRLGAVAVLNQPDQATCQEFTDLFITLARANQIPAKRIIGYAYSENPRLRPLSLVSDILHTWPEYYDADQQSWIPIDPTWGNTTQGVDYFHQFDLNHLVFAINGVDSQLPYPAGAYKLANQETKDLTVEFGHNFTLPNPEIQLDLKSQPILGFNFPGFYQLVVKNLTGRAIYQLDLTTQPQLSNIVINPQSTTSLNLLPWQTQIIPLRIYNRASWWPITTDISVTAETTNLNVNQNFTITTSGPLDQLSTQTSSWIGLGGGLICLTLLTGSILVWQRRRSRSLRRKG